MNKTILKSTERGQITLPKKWRSNFDTDNFMVQMFEDKLIIMPLDLQDALSEEILFDADRDNDGKGISPDQMIKALRKVRHG